EFIAFTLLISNLLAIQTQTLGHYWWCIYNVHNQKRKRRLLARPREPPATKMPHGPTKKPSARARARSGSSPLPFHRSRRRSSFACRWRRLPQFHLVAFRVDEPSEAAVLVFFDFAHDLRTAEM